MEAVLIGGVGAAIGSFLNVVAYRVPRGESVATPRSRCPGCETTIRARDNVPVLSWLWLRARCRGCGERIPARYPLIEAITAAVFAAVILVRGLDAELFLSLPFAALLIAVAAIDLEHRIVPNRLLLPAAIWAVTVGVVVDPGVMPERLAAGGGAFLLLLLAALAYPAGMGMGDVKLAGVMGLFLGVAVAPSLLIAFLAGSVVGVAMIAALGPSARKKGVPFAPFLALGGLVGLLAGPELVDLYIDRFFG